MQFGELGAFGPIFAAQEHLGRPFWDVGTTLGSHFGISGAPWGAILAPRVHPGGPWEQQGGQEVACHRLWIDFAVISELVYFCFSDPKYF